MLAYFCQGRGLAFQMCVFCYIYFLSPSKQLVDVPRRVGSLGSILLLSGLFRSHELEAQVYRRVYLVGRRGPVQAACTAKELREILGV